ncbi:L-threonylcarbamoyladenylate synthase [Paenibacillus sp. y28]|uniref:L-threonylcarbamoyladenylate synthase n=1 Tax=Paenibacillus sp. y28 TaxID=3129110 RepID=UPI003FA7261E
MNTFHWKVPLGGLSGQDNPMLHEAAQLLREGELVAFPTETVYGLGADAANPAAVEAIFAAKGRPSDNPLIVHIADRSQLTALCRNVPPLAERLMDAFWPGPLTFVLPVRPEAVSGRVTAGLDTVAVRMPDHPAALALIRQSGRYIAAPSANRSGRPSPTRAEHVLEDLDGRICGIVDAGPTGLGLESTVIQLEGDVLHVLRPGGITAEQLQAVCGEKIHVVVSEGPAPAADAPSAMREASDEQVNRVEGQAVISTPDLEAPRSPGMKYTHYAPAGQMILVTGERPQQVLAKLQQLVNEAKQQGHRTAVLAFADEVPLLTADVVLGCGADGQLEPLAAQLYHALRFFDEAGATFIAARGCRRTGIGHALLNRMEKAAGHRIEQV